MEGRLVTPAPKPEPVKRCSRYTEFFGETIGFSLKDTEKYGMYLENEDGWDTKESFEEETKNGDIDLSLFLDEKGTPIFKRGHQIQLKKKLSRRLLLSQSSSSSITNLDNKETMENHLHANDILFDNRLYFLDTSYTIQTENIYPVYSNNDKRRPLILKVNEDPDSRDKERSFLNTLRHPDIIVDLMDKIDFVNMDISNTLEPNKQYHGLKKKVEDGVKNIRVDMNKMTETIVDELSGDNLAQYTEMKLIMHQLQSSIPKDRATMEQCISAELLRLMKCVQNQSSKAEVANLQDTLLHQLYDQNNSLEVIQNQLEIGSLLLMIVLRKFIRN